MIHRVARERQPPSLDRVGEDDARPRAVACRLVEGLDDGREVVAADVADQRAERLVGGAREKSIERGVRIAVARGDQRLSHRSRGQPEERVVLGIGHRLEPRPQPLAAGPRKARAEPRAPAQLDDVPPGGGEPRAELAPPRVGNDAVEALAVHVHDPQQVAQVGERVLEQRFPDVPLVELGVAEHGDEAPRVRHATVIRQVTCGQRSEGGHHPAEPHRARREIHDLRVLAATRIRLEPAKAPEPHQRLAVEPAAQVFDRVEGRRAMRLEGDDVAALERMEVERGEQAHDGRG